MSIFYRWLKFNLVGAVGVAVQLAALTLFNRWFHGHYLPATIAALEVTLLHNFVWHERYTWRDTQGSALNRLLRFHLSNGLVSLCGNLMVGQGHLPVLAANSIAILCCSVANFVLSHHWIFAAGSQRKTTVGIRRLRSG
jgi:dolichol-phosphate mannosyltransferase